MTESLEQPQDLPPLPPAELAAVFPPLLPILDKVASEHQVFYGKDEKQPSAADVLGERHQLSPFHPERRASDLLAQRVLYINRRLDGPNNYAAYLTGSEVITLSDRLLEVQNGWGDPDYMEGLVAEIEPFSQLQKLYAERDDNGYFIRLAEDPEPVSPYATAPLDDQPDLSRPAWDKQGDDPPFPEHISDLAVRASEITRAFMLAGFNRNIHRHQYLINLIRPDHENIEASQLVNVQQFVADRHALEVIGERQGQASKKLRAQCLENSRVIQDWLAKNDDLIVELPSDFRLQKPHHIRTPHIERIFEDKSASVELHGLVNIMRIRLASHDRSGIFCRFDNNINSFYNLQRRIGLTVQRIITQLPEYTPTQLPETTTTPIVPLT